jgi:hypothetical protein
MSLAHALRPIVMATALCISGGAIAKAPPRYGALVYSNLCVEPQSGDIGGTRITLLRLGDGDRVIYEYTEGAVAWPLFVARAKVDSRAGTISFEVRPEADTLTFEGKFTDSILVGAFSAKAEPVRLPRIADLSRPMPKCP